MKKFDHLDFLHTKVLKLRTSNVAGRLVHRSGDIDASGDESEISAREIIKELIPAKWGVEQGHLVDSNFNCSPQFDALIFNEIEHPILFKGANGVTYIPFDLCTAIGEVKSTYYASKKPITAFAKALKDTFQTVSRRKIIRNDNLVNPLFRFMIFFNKNDFDLNEFTEAVDSDLYDFMPSCIVFLDFGIVANGPIKYLSLDPPQWMATGFNIHPELSNNNPAFPNGYFYRKVAEDEYTGTVALGYLISFLMEHLKLIDIPPISYIDYVWRPENLRDGIAAVPKRLLPTNGIPIVHAR